MSKQTKKITLDSLSAKVDKLASAMESGFKGLEGKMDKGFQAVRQEMATGFEKAEENRENLAVMISNGFDRTATKDDIAKLEQGQENIQLRLDSMAPNFEVRELTRRVKRLEDRAGIRHSIQH